MQLELWSIQTNVQLDCDRWGILLVWWFAMKYVKQIRQFGKNWWILPNSFVSPLTDGYIKGLRFCDYATLRFSLKLQCATSRISPIAMIMYCKQCCNHSNSTAAYLYIIYTDGYIYRIKKLFEFLLMTWILNIKNLIQAECLHRHKNLIILTSKWQSGFSWLFKYEGDLSC